jgi:DNA helicase HerA-like ATPase
MRGRSKLADSREIQYRVRLNNEENQMISYISEKTGKAKAEIFRIAMRLFSGKLHINAPACDRRVVYDERDLLFN